MSKVANEVGEILESKLPTKIQIEDWKKKHGGVYQFTVDGKILIIREPDIKDLERAQSSDPKKQKPFNFHRSIVENCKLYVEDGLLTNDKNFLAVCTQLDEIIDIREAEVKKL